MRIETDIKLDYNDVLIRPKRSTLTSRFDVDMNRTYTFRHSQKKWTGVPIMASNMDTVGTFEMAKSLHEFDMVTCIAKHYNTEWRWTGEMPERAYNTSICVVGGISDEDIDNIEKIYYQYNTPFVGLDVANGYTINFVDSVKKLRNRLPDATIIAGNVVTADMTQELILAGADIIKVGIGPGSICTTRVVAGVGMPQFSAVYKVSQFCNSAGVPVIADGGIRHSGDAVKALGAGAECVMLGSLFAGVDESPGEPFLYNGRSFKSVRGMGSLAAMVEGGKARYGQAGVSEQQKLVPEGIEGMVPSRGPVAPFVYQFVGGIRSGMGYLGAKDLEVFRSRASFVRITGAGVQENHPHDVQVTKEAPNYWKTN